MLAQNQNQPTNQPRMFFTEKGLIQIEKCPRCDSEKFNFIDFNRFFHCWQCRLVCAVSELKGVKVL